MLFFKIVATTYNSNVVEEVPFIFCCASEDLFAPVPVMSCDCCKISKVSILLAQIRFSISLSVDRGDGWFANVLLQ